MRLLFKKTMAETTFFYYYSLVSLWLRLQVAVQLLNTVFNEVTVIDLDTICVCFLQNTNFSHYSFLTSVSQVNQ